MSDNDFRQQFKTLTGHWPFPWQIALFNRFAQDKFPSVCNLPTGLGKTNVIAVWLIALLHHPEKMPRRLAYVVNRRTVVDQTTSEVEKLCENLAKLKDRPQYLQQLAISTLRGQFADNRQWSADPSRPAVICGTVDMIGSRLLFSGYGCGFKSRPLHAGFLGQDALLVHDEAHLEPAFQTLIETIQKEQERCNELAKFHVMALSATTRNDTEKEQEKPFELTDAEKKPPDVVPDPPTEPIHHVWRRLKAKKAIELHPNNDETKLADEMADLVLDKFKDTNRAVLIFVRKVEDVKKIVEKIVKKLQKDSVQQLTGTLRGLERDRMADPRKETACRIFARFLKPPKSDAKEEECWKIESRTGTVYLVCTSAGEVGVNISADHMVCDLSTFDSMAQRFGRVNRFGDRNDTKIHIVHPTSFEKKRESTNSINDGKRHWNCSIS